MEELQNLNIPIVYMGYDISTEPVFTAQQRLQRFCGFHKVSIVQCDISKIAQFAPKVPVDIVLCRDLIQHLTYGEAALVLEGLSKLRAQNYLITTHKGPNVAIETGNFYYNNLSDSPFGMKALHTHCEEDPKKESAKYISMFMGASELSIGAKNLSTIPKIIHQMWLTDPSNPREVPRQYDKVRDTFRAHNPGYEIRFWTRDDIDDLWNMPPLARFKPLLSKMLIIEQCDMSRYAIMFAYGGIYADLNVQCLKPLDPIMQTERLVLVKEPDVQSTIVGCNDPMLTNAFMASSPGDSFWLQLMARIETYYVDVFQSKKKDYVMINTGPVILWKHAKDILGADRLSNITKGKTCAFQPLGCNKTVAHECNHLDPEDAYCVKLWWSSAGWGISEVQPVVTFEELNLKKNTDSLRSNPRKSSILIYVVSLSVLVVLVFLVILYAFSRTR